MPLSTYLANEMLDHTYGNGAFTVPTTWWVQLHYGDPGLAGTNNAWTTAGRMDVRDFTNAVDGKVSNASAVSWVNVPPVAVGMTQITHFTIWSSLLVYHGTLYGSGAFSNPTAMSTGDIATIPAGAMEVSL